MTKFILHGGETSVPNEHNKAFYQEWVNDFAEDEIPTILLTYFSRPKEIWGELKESEIKRFKEYTNDRKVNFIVADDNIEKFKDQIKESDVIYFRGGEPERIVNIVKEIKDEFLQLIDGKTYIGSSAGVMFISDYSRIANKPWGKYLGILPINSIVHYSKELNENLEISKRTPPDSDKECILLPETEFIVKTF